MSTISKERFSFQDVKDAVKRRRFIKDLAHGEDISLNGVRGRKLENILNTADEVLERLQAENADWIEEKRRLFGDYLSSVDRAQVEQAYILGFTTTITQEFRTYRRVSKGETVKLDDHEYLRGVITAYTVDFLRSLRLSQRFGINPNTALDVARLSYHYNPTRLIQLVRQYPDINLGVISSAALGYPKNPEAFLDGYMANVARLTEKYPDIPRRTITIAALGYPRNPDAFIEKVKAGEQVLEITGVEELEAIVPTEITDLEELQ